MGGHYCCVPYCQNKQNPERKEGKISFHKLPADKTLRTKWLARIGRKVGPKFRINDYTRICSEHFNPSDFYSGYVSGRKELKEGVVPSIIPWRQNAGRVKSRHTKDMNEESGDESDTSSPKVCLSDTMESGDEDTPILTRLKQTSKQRREIRDELCTAWQSSAFTDLTVYCVKNQVEAHRLILASASPFLKTLLEEADDEAALVMPDFRFEDVMNLLQLLYSGSVFVDPESAIGVQELCQTLAIQPEKHAIKRISESTEESPLKKLKNQEIIDDGSSVVMPVRSDEKRLAVDDENETERVEAAEDFTRDDELSSPGFLDHLTDSDGEASRRETNRSPSQDLLFECHMCQRGFPTENLLEAHRAFHIDFLASEEVDESITGRPTSELSDRESVRDGMGPLGRSVITYSNKRKSKKTKVSPKLKRCPSNISSSQMQQDSLAVIRVQPRVEEVPVESNRTDVDDVWRSQDPKAVLIEVGEPSERAVLAPTVATAFSEVEGLDFVMDDDEMGEAQDDQRDAVAALCLLKEETVTSHNAVDQSSPETAIQTYVFQNEDVESAMGAVNDNTYEVQQREVDGALIHIDQSVGDTYIPETSVVTYVVRNGQITERVFEQDPGHVMTEKTVAGVTYEVDFENIKTEVITDMAYLDTETSKQVNEDSPVDLLAVSDPDTVEPAPPPRARALPVVVSVTAKTEIAQKMLAEMSLPKLKILRRRIGPNNLRKSLYPCCYCEHVSDSFQQRAEHLAEHDERAACPVCKNEFPPHELSQHVEKVHVKPKTSSATDQAVESILAGMSIPKVVTLRVRNGSKDGKVRVYPCCYCSLVLTNRDDRIDHLLTHDVPASCPVCEAIVQAHDLFQHVAKEHVKARTKEPCRLCGQSFLDLKRHILRAHKNEVQVERRCKLCPELPFYTNEALRCHYESNHPETKVLCDGCGLDFYPFEAKEHKHRIEEKMKECYICGKHVQKLQRHITEVHSRRGRRNDRERIKLQCEKCSKMVFSYTTLRKHMLKQHNETGYPVCILCEKHFESEEVLNEHRKQAHPKSSSHCSICKESVPSVLLPKHILDHAWYELGPGYSPENQSVPQNIQCSRCGAAFTCTAYLVNHIVGHLDPSRTFECDTCFKCFKSERRLIWHKDLMCKTPEEVRQMKRITSKRSKERIKQRKLASGEIVMERRRGRKSKQQIIEYETDFACMLCEEQFGSYDLCRDHMYSVHDNYDTEVE